MTGKENVFILTARSGEFICRNMDAFKRQMSIIFPCFLVVAIACHLATYYQNVMALYALFIPFLYLISTFTLSWHRVSLRGPEEPAKNPFVWEKGDGKFHAIFLGIMLLMTVFSSASERVTLYLEGSGNQALVVIGSIASLIVLCSVMYYATRLMFFLPAQSVGVALSYDDVKRASNGALLRFIFSMIITTAVLMLVTSIYLVIVTVVLQATGANDEVQDFTSAIVAFFLSTPIYVSAFFYWAVNVTILSRLYNWGMQNNA